MTQVSEIYNQNDCWFSGISIKKFSKNSHMKNDVGSEVTNTIVILGSEVGSNEDSDAPCLKISDSEIFSGVQIHLNKDFMWFWCK